MRAIGKALGAITLAVVLVSAAAPAAHAATVTKPDARGDAPRSLDISKVTYRNAVRHVSARIKVPGLERDGAARLIVARRDSDVAFVAKVRVRQDGSLRKRFSFQTNTTNQKRRCAFRAQWRARDGVIVISVPQRCVNTLSRGPHYLAASTGYYRDRAPVVRRLARG